MESILYSTFIAILLSANFQTISAIQETHMSFTLVDECDEYETCVRFCCENATEFLDKSFFDLSKRPEGKHLEDPYKVLKGRQECEEDMYSMLYGDAWEFSEARI